MQSAAVGNGSGGGSDYGQLAAAAQHEVGRVRSQTCQLGRQYIEAEAGKQATEKHLRIPCV